MLRSNEEETARRKLLHDQFIPGTCSLSLTLYTSQSNIFVNQDDIWLICDNCVKFNPPESIYHKEAEKLRMCAQRTFDTWIPKIDPSTLPSQPSSSSEPVQSLHSAEKDKKADRGTKEPVTDKDSELNLAIKVRKKRGYEKGTKREKMKVTGSNDPEHAHEEKQRKRKHEERGDKEGNNEEESVEKEEGDVKKRKKEVSENKRKRDSKWLRTKEDEKKDEEDKEIEKERKRKQGAQGAPPTAEINPSKQKQDTSIVVDARNGPDHKEREELVTSRMSTATSLPTVSTSAISHPISTARSRGTTTVSPSATAPSTSVDVATTVCTPAVPASLPAQAVASVPVKTQLSQVTPQNLANTNPQTPQHAEADLSVAKRVSANR